MPPKRKAARTYDHLVKLLLLLAFSKNVNFSVFTLCCLCFHVSSFIVEQCGHKGEADPIYSFSMEYGTM